MKKITRFLGMAVIAILIVCFTPDTADASGSQDISDGKITIKDSDSYTITGTSSENYITVEKGNPTITISNLEIDLCNETDDGDSVEAAPISIKKGCSVTIIVDGNCKLYGGNNTGIGANWGYAGINIEKGASLTLKGDSEDSLVVYGGGDYGGSEEGAAAIGSNADCDMGSLTIKDSLTIEAHGAVKAAGIGGGCDEVAGDITIYGGNITAEGGRSAAGIGCGDSVGSGDGGNGNNITIYGGTIKAVGGKGAAGIGGSDGGDLNGTIKISGGTVTATGGEEGAGIGGGLEGYVSKITIEGGTVKANGGKNAAGIGGGNAKGSGDGGDVGSIYISAGQITAYGGGGKDETNGEGGAGIGGGDGGEVGSLEIKQNGLLEITAYGGKWGAGIGSATSEVESHNIDTIKITLEGGSIKAVGGYQGAGIGGGNTTAKNIYIYGRGNIEAVGKNEGAAIGAGEGEDGGNITIRGYEGERALVIQAVTEETYSTAVIGGADSCGEDITLANANITLENKSQYLDPEFHSSGIGNGHNTGAMGDILIENCRIEDKQGEVRHGASIGAGWCADVGSITIKNTEFVGGTIGASYSAELINEVKVDGITIEDSDINASNTSDQIKAAIGSGQNTVVTEINIRNSNIHAYSASGAGIGSGGYESDSKGDAVRWTGGSCGDITIEGSTVTAFGRDGGAGIGGGWGTSTDDITIVNSYVKAEAEAARHDKQGGAGIGGGYAESCGNITIKNSTVEAEGTGYSAGIGCGGIDTMATFWWDTTCHSIAISSSNVTATGGSHSAGIGTGCGAQFSGSASIDIEDSTVESTGGEKAAGIGAGSNGSGGSGGEACDIHIMGKSKVYAKGGDGGAGIGGGYGGGADTILIDLDETTYDSGETVPWKYYVKAEGGKGGAGLGGGGEHGEVYEDIPFGTAGHGADSIRIYGGYVYAHGGDEDNGDYAGAGAGIGGGGRGGRLEDLVVTGGFVVAHSGVPLNWEYAGNDIGYGGGYDPAPLLKDGDAKISGGTLLGDLSDEFDITINGGSVSCHTTKAKRTDGTKVYQTKLQTGENYFKPKDFKVSLGDYGTTDIFSADNGRIYLYLPITDSDTGSTADYTYNGESRHYYGKTTDDSNAWIKMDGKLILEGPETEPAVGDDFAVSVKSDAGLSDETNIKFTLVGNPDIKIVEDETVTTMPGAKVVLNADKRTEYAITAEAENETEMYWSAKGTYKGRVTKEKGTIDIVEDPTKVYDGKPVENPSVSTNSNGTVTYKYFDASGGVKGTELSGAPTGAGTYLVEAALAETNGFTASSDELIFKIMKRPVTLDLTATEQDNTATVVVTMFGAVDDPGSVTIAIGDNTETIPFGAPDETTGLCTGSITFSNVAGDTNYTVKATYADNANYTCTNSPVEDTFYKNKAKRTPISVGDISAVYGDGNKKIIINYGDSGHKESDTVTYELVYDDWVNNYGISPAVELPSDSSGMLTIKNAGRAVVKVTVSNDSYEDAVAYSVIKISRADLKVTSYAYRGEDDADNRVDKITYGSVDSDIKYGLEYEGFIPGDGAGNFANGTLEAVPLNETVPAGEATIGIVKKGEPFISRNYKLDLEPGKVTITPATLWITADDKTGTYGTEPEYTCSFGDEEGNYDLMQWDKAEDVIESVGTEKSYENYKPGEHKDAIVVETKKNNSNYAFSDDDGKSTVKPGKLTVKKADVTLTVEIKSKVYDGMEIEPAVLSATPVAVIPAEQLESCQEVKIRYFELTEDEDSNSNVSAFSLFKRSGDSGMKQLSSAPKDAGSYMAVAYVDEDECYNSASKAVTFTIRKARCNVEKPQVPDIEMRDGLKLSDQKLPSGWSWLYPDKELSVGAVKEYALYTPEDSRNYYPEMRSISFNVYEKTPNPPGSGGDPDGSGGGKADDDSAMDTGDNSNVLLWAVVAILALAGAIIVIIIGRRKEK